MKTLIATGLLLAGLAGLMAVGPAVRTGVNDQVQSWIGWTDAARQADPVGFANHVESRLADDLQTLQATRGDLAAEVGKLSEEQRKLQALLDHADRFAEEFRGIYQDAVENDSFPIEVRNGAYTEEQAVGQVSSLLAEAEGYRSSLEQLESIRSQAKSRLESLVVQINDTQTQLATMATRRALIQARKLDEEGQRLVAQVDALLQGNQSVIQGNPVRSVSELMATASGDRSARTSTDAARRFLVTKPEPHAGQLTTMATPAISTEPVKDRVEAESVTVAKPKIEIGSGKPIYSQD